AAEIVWCLHVRLRQRLLSDDLLHAALDDAGAGRELDALAVPGRAHGTDHEDSHACLLATARPWRTSGRRGRQNGVCTGGTRYSCDEVSPNICQQGSGDGRGGCFLENRPENSPCGYDDIGHLPGNEWVSTLPVPKDR